MGSRGPQCGRAEEVEVGLGLGLGKGLAAERLAANSLLEKSKYRSKAKSFCNWSRMSRNVCLSICSVFKWFQGLAGELLRPAKTELSAGEEVRGECCQQCAGW